VSDKKSTREQKTKIQKLHPLTTRT